MESKKEKLDEQGRVIIAENVPLIITATINPLVDEGEADE